MFLELNVETCLVVVQQEESNVDQFGYRMVLNASLTDEQPSDFDLSPLDVVSECLNILLKIVNGECGS